MWRAGLPNEARGCQLDRRSSYGLPATLQAVLVLILMQTVFRLQWQAELRHRFRNPGAGARQEGGYPRLMSARTGTVG